MWAKIELLEMRRLLSHGLPADVFAEASDTYGLTIGTAVQGVALNGLGWGVNRSPSAPAVPEDFVIALPAGPTSPQLFQWAASGQPLASVRIESFTPQSRLRSRWELRDAFVTTYGQSSGSDGVLHDFASFNFQRLIYSYFLPNPGGGNDIELKLDYNRMMGFATFPPLTATGYMSTSPDVPATMEFGGGQLPLNGYSFQIVAGGGGSTQTSGAAFTTIAGAEGVTMLGRLLEGSSIPDAVHLQRDGLARPLSRTRFEDGQFTHYSFSDSTLDAVPRGENLTLLPDMAQQISYTYSSNGDMNPPTSAGWDFRQQRPYNPPPVTAFIRPPTHGARNTPLAEVDVYFSHPVTSLSLNAFRFDGLASAGLALTMFDGGSRWRIGNLAPQQSADGDYAVKLFALGSGVTSSAGSKLIGSTGITWTLDTAAPAVNTSSFEYLARHALHLSFSEDVGGSLSVNDITLQNVTNNTTIPGSAMALVYAAGTEEATVTFPGLPGGLLPDGEYRLVLGGGGVADRAGNPLPADHTLDFFFLNGDANHDGRVNLTDFNILANNFGRSPRDFSQGDFTYDGAVNLADFNVLAGRFGQVLAGQAVKGHWGSPAEDREDDDASDLPG